MAPTNLARLIQAAMDEQNLSQGDVERRGGPSKQSLGRLLKHWQGTRSLDPDTLPKLSIALGIAQRTLGRAAAVDMGLLPADEARDDALASLADALRERAGERDRDAVVAAARAVWRVLEQHAAVDEGVTPVPVSGPGKRSVSAAPGLAAAPTPDDYATAASKGTPIQVQIDAAEPDPNADEEGPAGGA